MHIFIFDIINIVIIHIIIFFVFFLVIKLSRIFLLNIKINHHGFIGTITDVENSTVNTLFIIEHEGNEVLMPAQEEFIKDMNQKERTMLVEMPEGMLNLDD